MRQSADAVWMSQRSECTTPEEKGSNPQDSKSWDAAGKKERERCVSTLITVSRHPIVADIARATPAAEPSEECAVEEFSGGWRKPALSQTGRGRLGAGLWGNLVSV